jgi:hypothetical protein
MPDPRGDQLFSERLEQLHDIDRAAAQRHHVLRHALVRDPVEAGGIQPGQPQIVLQAEPRGRHLADRRDPSPHQLRHRETGAGSAADQQEGVARHRLAKADKVAIGALGVELVDPHRPAPGDIDRAVEQRLWRLARARRAGETHLDPFLLVSPERQGRVVRRVEQAAQ